MRASRSRYHGRLMAPRALTLIDKARRALDAGDGAAAFGALVALWQATRAPEVAPLVERLGRTVWPAPGPPRASEIPTRVRSLLARRTHAELGEILALLPRLPLYQALDALGRLRNAPPDPRTTTALLALLEATHWPSSLSNPVWESLFDRLVELGDPRALEPVRTRADRPIRGVQLGRWMRGALPAVAARLAERCVHPALPGAARAALAALDARIPEPAPDPAAARAETAATETDAWLARVLAHPEDEALRHVYADWLQERGDPRGEFIALQLAGTRDEASHKRAKALLERSWGRWVGGIRHAARRDGIAFERGFLVRCALTKRMLSTEKWEAVVAAPEWATVEELAITARIPAIWARRVAHLPALRSLRTLYVADAKLREELQAGPLAARLVPRMGWVRRG